VGYHYKKTCHILHINRRWGWLDAYIYSKKAGIENPLSPNTIRTFLLSWLKEQGIEDEMLLLYSGHESRYALAHYKNEESRGIDTTQDQYESVIHKLPFL
jgi:hypothetical protein